MSTKLHILAVSTDLVKFYVRVQNFGLKFIGTLNDDILTIISEVDISLVLPQNAQAGNYCSLDLVRVDCRRLFQAYRQCWSADPELYTLSLSVSTELHALQEFATLGKGSEFRDVANIADFYRFDKKKKTRYFLQ